MTRRAPRPRVPLTCEVCGIIIMVAPTVLERGRRRCSTACYKIWKSQGASYDCIACGKNVAASPSQAATRKYCSMECLKAHKKARIQCEVCGKTRGVTPTVLKNGARFCSWECSRIALNKPRPTMTCIVCGKQKEIYPYMARAGRKFCSYSCRSIHTMLHMGTHPTRIEIILYDTLKAMNIEYIAQHPLPEAKTIPDAFIPSLNLAIYADGTYWHGLPKAVRRDKYINRQLEKLGYEFLRLPEPVILANCRAALETAIETIVAKQRGNPSA